METITINLTEYIELLEVLLYSKKEAQQNDSSWNYGIEELESKIKDLNSAGKKQYYELKQKLLYLWYNRQ